MGGGPKTYSQYYGGTFEHHDDGSETFRSDSGNYSETRNADGGLVETSTVESEFGWLGGDSIRVARDENGVTTNVQRMDD